MVMSLRAKAGVDVPASVRRCVSCRRVNAERRPDVLRAMPDMIAICSGEFVNLSPVVPSRVRCIV
jgi:hypothetical protein